MIPPKTAHFFTFQLLKWNNLSNHRQMPWKGEKDPYKIWLSEIILQQTRVEQGLAYYNRFIQMFPDINTLANAPETKVFKLWEGLGYYTRCKNLLATAKYIAAERKGKFPDTYEEIRQLKGVGPYTAAAISSFAYNLPYAVVDGNVIRVLSRFFGISIPSDSTYGRKYFEELAGLLIQKDQAGIYNQAIMDFGATICKPRLAACSTCPLAAKCKAYRENAVEAYPVKSRALVKKDRWFYYIIAAYRGKYYFRQRTAKDIWQNLHEFILIESDKEISRNKLPNTSILKQLAGKTGTITAISAMFTQQLTHQTIHGCFIHVMLTKSIQLEGYMLAGSKELSKLAFPKMIAGYLDKKG